VLGLFLLVFAVSPATFTDLLSDAERENFNARIDGGIASEAEVTAFVENIKSYRADVASADAWRSFAFVVVGGLLLFLFGRGKLSRNVLLPALGLLVLVDLWGVDKRYVNNEKDRGRYLAWEDARAIELPFKPTAADMAILEAEWNPAAEADLKNTLQRMRDQRADAPVRERMVGKDEELIARFGSLRRNSDHRVLTLANPFNDSRVSYFHKSVGGYHGAKLKRYQDLIEFHLAPAIQRVAGLLRSGTTQQAVDSLLAREGVLNMLNTRYLIYSDERAPIRNTNALGSAWFVDEVRWMKDADEEITTLGTIDPARTALVDQRFKGVVGEASLTADPSASATLDSYRANELSYTVRSQAGGMVVFSAIWYGPDWVATIDGQEVPHVRTNYVLRGLVVPAGEHKVVFKVKGRAFEASQNIALASSLLVLLLVLGVVGRSLRSAEA
jgi:hypothetical protein